MNLNKVVCIVLSLVGIAGAVTSLIMLISAIEFCEWGRVVFYCVLMAIAVEIVILNIFSLRMKK